jgi:two-component system nitrogen regulation response regulator GlnG
MLSSHSWPGNIRELRNVVRQAVLLTPDFEIHAEQIRHLLKSSETGEVHSVVEVAVPLGSSLKEIGENGQEEAEKQAIRQALRSAQGNKSEAARVLKTAYKTLHGKIKKYGLE